MYSNLYEDIVRKKETISLIGLGYVGLPVAVAFAKKNDVIGYDCNKEKIGLYLEGRDPTNEVGDEEIKNSAVRFTSDPRDLREAKFHIVAVPTPITESKVPDLRALESASKTLGENMAKGSVVVYESTVYPGVTEDICVPILEKASGLKCGVDFKIGYSPERINPGDKVNRLETIVKVVAGMDEETLDIVAGVYSLVVDAGVFRAKSIKVAEAAKVIENSQRDINIAFMNELAIIFDKMGIDTKDVLAAAGTKWNFLKFYPGLVGGHCIGVDPYYLTYRANQFNYESQVILAGRRINDGMGKYIAERIVKEIIKADKNVKHAKVGILGFTFKENVPDIRNTRVIDIVHELEEYGIVPLVTDCLADKKEVKTYYNLDLCDLEQIENLDVLVLAVNHDDYKNMSRERIDSFFSGEKRILFDIKGLFNREDFADDYVYWRL